MFVGGKVLIVIGQAETRLCFSVGAYDMQQELLTGKWCCQVM